jgi:hypothetical protein
LDLGQPHTIDLFHQSSLRLIHRIGDRICRDSHVQWKRPPGNVIWQVRATPWPWAKRPGPSESPTSPRVVDAICFETRLCLIYIQTVVDHLLRQQSGFRHICLTVADYIGKPRFSAMDIVPGGLIAVVEQGLMVLCRKIEHQHRPAHDVIHGVFLNATIHLTCSLRSAHTQV